MNPLFQFLTNGVLCIGSSAPVGVEKVNVAGNVVVTGRISDSHIVVGFVANPVFNASAGSSFEFALNGDVTASTLSNTIAGQKLTFIITQAGSFNFTWPSNVFGGGLINTSLPVNAVCVQTFVVKANGRAYPISPMTVN
jgi:hypothetical protein